MISVLVADDHPAIRAGLVALLRLEPGLVPVAAATTAAEALDSAHARAPTVALVDYHLPDMDGLTLCHRLRSEPDSPQVIIYSAFADERLALPAALLGANAVLPKTTPSDELFHVIRSAARGERNLTISPALLTAARGAVGLDDLPILGMLADDTPPTQIAAVLGLTTEAIERRIDEIVDVLKRDIDSHLPPPLPLTSA
jgi:DNA-binding NarL/FixJ family response regulator